MNLGSIQTAAELTSHFRITCVFPTISFN